MQIYTSSHFRRRYKKLNKEIKKRAQEREKVFVANIFDPRIETHKLHGKLKEQWSYSIGYDHRIAFIFLENGDVLYVDVGTHDELYR